jgi:hypothetical protein
MGVRRLAPAAVAVLLVAAVTGGSSAAGDRPADRLPGWFAALDHRLEAGAPSSDVMQLDLSAGCDLVDHVAVAGHELDFVGSGVAAYGTGGQGFRYQCAWTGDEASDRPANVRLEVVRLAGDAGPAQYRHLVEVRPHSVEVVSAGRRVSVAEVVPPPSDARTFDAELVLDDRSGAVHLLVELTDPSVARSFEAQQVADLLTRYTGPAS